MITESQFAKSAELLWRICSNKSCGRSRKQWWRIFTGWQTQNTFWTSYLLEQLRRKGIIPENYLKGNEDILYPTWQSGKYGPVSKQHDRLNRAIKINREAALSSASWGKFQIMGFNCNKCDCSSVEEFITHMGINEDEHLKAFICYIKSTFLDDELRARDWKGFARAYNGKFYWKNNYDKKLEAAYLKYK